MTEIATQAPLFWAYQNDSEDAKSRFSTMSNMDNVMKEHIC